MQIQTQIQTYLDNLAPAKRAEMQHLHEVISALLPESQLWFIDGTDESGKIVCNPNIGYGLQHLKYANGKTKAFYQVGLSSNTTGISVYILGLADKKYLAQTYGKTLGNASITGYCIKFKSLNDIVLEVLTDAILDGIAQTKV